MRTIVSRSVGRVNDLRLGKAGKMATDTENPDNNLDKEQERLHHDVQELAALRDTEHRLEERIEGEIAEIERIERDGHTIDLIVNTRAKALVRADY